VVIGLKFKQYVHTESGIRYYTAKNYMEVKMRTKTNFLFKTTILIVLIVGTIGCRSNGGPWYDVRSYSFYNPLRPENHSRIDSSSTIADNNNLTKPHMDSRVDVRQPEGGYYEQQRDTSTLAHNPSNYTNPNAGSTTYPNFQPTGFHSEQPSSVSPMTPSPSPYSAAAPNYGSSSVAPPINPAGYTSPSGYGQPTDYSVPSAEIKNDMPVMSNPYAVSNGTSTGYPITTTYPSESTYPPASYDTTRSNNAGVASPFANPTGQPQATGSPIPNASYGGLPTSAGTDASYAGSMPYGSPAGVPNTVEQNPAVNTYGTNGIPASAGNVYTNPSTFK
jgi:hypothetical protein